MLQLQLQPQISNPTTKVIYLVTKDMLTISFGGKTDFVSAAHPLFSALVKFLPRSSEFDLATEGDDFLSRSKQIIYSQMTNGKYVDGKIDGIEIPDCLTDRLIELVGKNLPYQPLLSFWSGLVANTHLSDSNRLRIVEFAGTKYAPLTWTGELVLYARSSMNPCALATPRISLIPEPKPVAPPQRYRLGTLDLVSRMCTDVGVMSDYCVKAGDILGFDANILFTSSFDLISELQEHHREESSIVEIVADSIAGTVIRKPYDASTAVAAVGYHQNLLTSDVVTSLEASYQMSSC
jgi:hypothetical protein